MKNFSFHNNNENKEVENYEYEAERLTMINEHMYHQVGLYKRNIRNLENLNYRYFDAKSDYNQIMYDEEKEYDFFKRKEKSIIEKINKPYRDIRLWRYKDRYYYRPNKFSQLLVGNEQEIAQEISSRFNNINIVFVNDLNDILSYKKTNIRIDTTYIAKNSIPVVDDEVFDTTLMEEIFTNRQRGYSRNILSYSPLLINRFDDFNLSNEPKSYAKYFIQSLANVKDVKFLANRLGKFFKHLNSSNAIVLIGNKDVSEGVLLNKVLKPIFGSQFCVTITDEMLQTKSLEDILKYKLIYHIKHIPNDEHNREKLKDILISTLVDKFIQDGDTLVPIHGQVVITVDEAHPFLKDFLSLSDVFFVNSMDDIITNLEEEDKISFHMKLHNSLELFSKELSLIGNMPDNRSKQNGTHNQEFSSLLDKIDEKIVKLIEGNILDPFNKNFENLIPVVERYKHTHITGMTGSGKSELLKVLIMADILRADGSVILLEPHGDLSQSVTKLVKDKTRLVYINPFLSESKIPTINLFNLPNKSEANIARLTQVILTVLKSVNTDESFTGGMEDNIEMCSRILIRNDIGSFENLYRFLGTKNKDLLQLGINSPNPLESEFFEDDFSNLKPTRDAVRRRLKKLLNDPIFSNMMNGQNTINFEEILNTKGKVIVFNIPKGKMPNTYKYYIRFIVEYIQILALKRADIKEEDRVHTHLYIDEAHNFITSTSTISEILTESRKYKLSITFAHQSISQIKDVNLRDILTSMTNVKIIGKNSNKTLEIMNKTLNTKLEDVEKLETGEFYLSAGNNAILKINITDKLLDGKEDISLTQEEEQRQYQLENYYRDINNIHNNLSSPEYLRQMFDEFIKAIKSIDIAYFEKIKANPKLYEELIYNFNDESDGASGYISKQDLFLYFNFIYPETPALNNKNLLNILKAKDEFFKQDVNINKTYNSKKRLLIS